MNLKLITLPFAFLLLINVGWAQQAESISTCRLDGLIISKTRYDSLKLERFSILKVRSMAPAESASAYGSRAATGVAIITTSKVFVVVSKIGPPAFASTAEEKEKLASPILESQVLRMRNLKKEELKAEFGRENEQGGVVVYLRE